MPQTLGLLPGRGAREGVLKVADVQDLDEGAQQQAARQRRRPHRVPDEQQERLRVAGC